MQALIDWSIAFATSGFYVSGILGCVFIGIAVPYFLINQIYKRGKVLVYLAKYIKHRRAFINWYKSQKPEVVKPVMRKRDK